MKVLNIKFRRTKKVYPFFVDDSLNYAKGDYVIVETIRGDQIGIVIGETEKYDETLVDEDGVKIREVKRKLDTSEIEKLSKLDEKAYEAYFVCKKIVREKLPEMNLVIGEYTFDEDAKTSDKVIGFMASFTLINGFQKTLYITVDEAELHGKKYSQTYKRGSGLWATDFEAMGKKTVLKKLLSKFAPKSIEMQKAIQFDQSSVKGNAESPDELIPEYVDNETYAEEIDFEANFNKVKNDIEAAKIAFAKGEITEEQFKSIQK